VRHYSINVAAAGGAGALHGIRIFEFDDDNRLVSRIEAVDGRVDGKGLWVLEGVDVTRWPTPQASGAAADTGAKVLQTQQTQQTQQVQNERLPSLAWPSSLDAAVVSAAVLPLQTMSTAELWRYSVHLSGQAQAAQRYQFQFWKKALYPLACIVMVALALPFAYLHARAGGVSLKVFGGIMLGISFVLLNNVAGHIGALRDWTPWVAASVPSLAYLLLSLAAFWWLVRYR
jgi:lipopolysaccharide export system permease protein